MVKALLRDLIERGLSTERLLLFVIDGAKALRSAITSLFGKLALIQRCQVHYADFRIMPSSTRGASRDRDVVLMRSA